MDYQYRETEQDPDTIVELPAIVTQEGDSTYISVTKEDLKTMHDRVFKEQLSNETFMVTIVRVEMAYIPVLFFILILATIVNIRWNRAFKRLQSLTEKVEKTPAVLEKIGILKAQRINLWDRIFVYIVIWISSMAIDLFLMFSGISTFPYGLMVITVFIISKILKRLVDGSTLQGVDDNDIINKFEEILDGMILKPIVGSISSKIAKMINSEKTTQKNE